MRRVDKIIRSKIPAGTSIEEYRKMIDDRSRRSREIDTSVDPAVQAMRSQIIADLVEADFQYRSVRKSRLETEKAEARGEYDQKMPKYSLSFLRTLVNLRAEGKIYSSDIVDGKVVLKWVVGGYEEGSCYDVGERSNVPKTPDEEPDLDVLDLILEQAKPGISFLEYKRLTKEVVERSSQTESGWYGGRTDYGVKTIDLLKLDSLISNDET